MYQLLAMMPPLPWREQLVLALLGMALGILLVRVWRPRLCHPIQPGEDNQQPSRVWIWTGLFSCLLVSVGLGNGAGAFLAGITLGGLATKKLYPRRNATSESLNDVQPGKSRAREGRELFIAALVTGPLLTLSIYSYCVYTDQFHRLDYFFYFIFMLAIGLIASLIVTGVIALFTRFNANS
jgi:hypothetical protein